MYLRKDRPGVEWQMHNKPGETIPCTSYESALGYLQSWINTLVERGAQPPVVITAAKKFNLELPDGYEEEWEAELKRRTQAKINKLERQILNLRTKIGG